MTLLSQTDELGRSSRRQTAEHGYDILWPRLRRYLLYKSLYTPPQNPGIFLEKVQDYSRGSFICHYFLPRRCHPALNFRLSANLFLLPRLFYSDEYMIPTSRRATNVRWNLLLENKAANYYLAAACLPLDRPCRCSSPHVSSVATHYRFHVGR